MTADLGGWGSEDTSRAYIVTHMWNLKNNTNESIYKADTGLQTQKTNLWLTKGKGGEGGIN